MSAVSNYALVISELGIDGGSDSQALGLLALLRQGQALDANSPGPGNYAEDVLNKLRAYVPDSFAGRALLQPLASLALRKSEGK